MLHQRIAGAVGVAACVIFWTAMFVLGGLRPSYSQLIDDVSELGALGTSHAAAWNVVGFIIPGIGLAIAGRAVAIAAAHLRTRSARIASWLLPLAGVGVAGQGLFPALMLNGAPVIESWHTTMHALMGLVSGLAWVVGVLALVPPLRRSDEWGRLWVFSVIAVLLVVAGSFSRTGGLPDGLVQRLVDAVMFAWFVVMCVKLMLAGSAKSHYVSL